LVIMERHPAKNPPKHSLGGEAGAALAQCVLRQLDKLCSAPLAPGLYLVATPIGNLGDISLRALATLGAADIVLCEDTRHSRKLFSAYGLQRRLQAYHDFSGEKDRARILGYLANEKSVALISDAGTPLIADPGYKLVRDAIAEGFPVYAIPGASALLTALAASGLSTDQFFFAGFLPPKDAARRAALEKLTAIPGTLILYESATRLVSTLEAIALIFPDRSVVVARELTKLFEEFLRGAPHELAESMAKTQLQGEFVLLIEAGRTEAPSENDISEALAQALATASLKEAVEEVAEGLGVSRKIVYNLALRMKGKKS
jgi:16S rRNA (cytidine1402-2'-O)-methyltransferase